MFMETPLYDESYLDKGQIEEMSEIEAIEAILTPHILRCKKKYEMKNIQLALHWISICIADELMHKELTR